MYAHFTVLTTDKLIHPFSSTLQNMNLGVYSPNVNHLPFISVRKMDYNSWFGLTLECWKIPQDEMDEFLKLFRRLFGKSSQYAFYWLLVNVMGVGRPPRHLCTIHAFNVRTTGACALAIHCDCFPPRRARKDRERAKCEKRRGVLKYIRWISEKKSVVEIGIWSFNSLRY